MTEAPIRHAKLDSIMPINRNQLLLELDEILGLPAGTLRGGEKLEELENWDSTSLMTLVAIAEANNEMHITPDQIVNCSTVDDLLRIAGTQS